MEIALEARQTFEVWMREKNTQKNRELMWCAKNRNNLSILSIPTSDSIDYIFSLNRALCDVCLYMIHISGARFFNLRRMKSINVYNHIKVKFQ